MVESSDQASDIIYQSAECESLECEEAICEAVRMPIGLYTAYMYAQVLCAYSVHMSTCTKILDQRLPSGMT